MRVNGVRNSIDTLAKSDLLASGMTTFGPDCALELSPDFLAARKNFFINSDISPYRISHTANTNNGSKITFPIVRVNIAGRLYA